MHENKEHFCMYSFLWMTFSKKCQYMKYVNQSLLNYCKHAIRKNYNTCKAQRVIKVQQSLTELTTNWRSGLFLYYSKLGSGSNKLKCFVKDKQISN